MEFFDTVVTEHAKQNVMEVLNSGRLSEGEWVKRFEQELDKQFGYYNCVTVNSGTSALHLALVLAGVKPGDEVILPAQTFVATGLAVLYCGAKPIFADIDKELGNIDVRELRQLVTPKTKAVICVAWGGNPYFLDLLEDFCHRYGLVLIQDNAQALGTTYEGWPLTEYGDFSCYSFQATKHLTTGDGGLVSCKNNGAYRFAKKLRWFGIDRKSDAPDETGERAYNLDTVGFKYHMNDYSAALGMGNLEGLSQRLERRKQIAETYSKNLPWYIQTYHVEGHSYWLYDLLVNRRSEFIKMMKSKSIPTSVVHVGIDRNEIFGGKAMANVNQRYWDEHHICIPCHSSLTDEDVQTVIDAINGGW